MNGRRARPAVEADRRSFARRLSREWSEPALRGAYLMLVNTAVTAILGFAFWVAAARLLPVDAVGMGVAAVAVVTTIANLGQLNLYQSAGVLLAQPGADARRIRGRLLGLVTVTTACIAVGAMVTGLPFGWFDAVPIAPLAVVGCAIAWSLFALKDGLLVAARRYWVLPVVNGGYGILKLVVLVSTLGSGAAAIIWATFLPIVVVVPLALAPLFGRRMSQADAVPTGTTPVSPPPRRGGDVGFVAVDYAGFIALQACTTLLPFIVLVLAGADAAAVFAAAWAIVLVLDTLAHNAGVPLASEAARTPSVATDVGRRVRWRTLALVTVAAAVVAIAARPLLELFGPEYAEVGTPVLQLLAAASIARAYLVISLALLRAQRRTGAILIVETGHAVVVLTAAVLVVPTYGALGMAASWLVGQLFALTGVIFAIRRSTRRAGTRGGGS